MIKSFFEYINEGESGSPDSTKYADDIVYHLRNNESSDSDYIEIRELEYKEPDSFDLVIQFKRETNPDFRKDSHFKTLQWEEINFDHYGFAIDANMYIDNKDLMVPEIIVTLILNPEMEPKLYTELRYRLIDIISHEVNHLNQVGWNREPFNTRPSSNIDRKKCKKSSKYFLLPDELESYVYGAYNRSKEQNVPIDKIFDKYLYPFLMSGELSDPEYDKVFKEWMIHALENFPDAKISLEDKKVSQIVNSL
jgi:hypothetical protein